MGCEHLRFLQIRYPQSQTVKRLNKQWLKTEIWNDNNRETFFEALSSCEDTRTAALVSLGDFSRGLVFKPRVEAVSKRPATTTARLKGSRKKSTRPKRTTTARLKGSKKSTTLPKRKGSKKLRLSFRRFQHNSKKAIGA